MSHSSFSWILRVVITGVISVGTLTTLVFSTPSQESESATFAQDKSTPKPRKIETLKLPVATPPLPPAQPPVATQATNSQPKQQPKQKSTKASPKRTRRAPAPLFDINKSLRTYSALFTTPVSWGMVAIGLAEGNYRVFQNKGEIFVQPTSLYYGHTDPGNLSWGDVVTNYGPCSDQGRSGGNITLAEQLCSQRALNALPTQMMDLHRAGINPDTDIEALINAADLYNQASPIHSRRFPEALYMARRGGKTGIDAIAWARTASFYLNEKQELDVAQGENKASGLLGICARERRPVTEWYCVYGDQLRRVKAINQVMQYYYQAQQAQAS